MQKEQQSVRYGTWLRDQLRKSSTMEDHEITTIPIADQRDPDDWNNHENSFEETLRREMLKYKQLYHMIQEDMTQLSEAHNKSLERIKELLDINETLRARLDKDDKIIRSFQDSSVVDMSMLSVKKKDK